MKSEIEWVIYVLSLSFQFCGALSVLFSSFGNSKKQVTKVLSNRDDEIVADENFNVKLPDDFVLNKVKTIFMNRIAFGQIAFGYAFVVFADVGAYSRIFTFAVVIILGILFICLTYVVSTKMAKRKAVKMANISADDLPSGTKITQYY